MTKEISEIKSRLKSLYNWIMPGLTSCFEDPYGIRAISLYEKYSNPFKLKRLGVTRLRKFLKEKSRQKMRNGLAEEVYKAATTGCELYESSGEYINYEDIQEEVSYELEILESYEKTRKKLDIKIKELYEKLHPSKNIETLPGISVTLAPIYLGLIGDPKRFKSQSKIRGYSGMVPRQNESGEKSHKGLNLTKDGPTRYRRAIYISADVARQWDPQLAKIYYEQMVHKGNCHTKAVCAVATHLTSRLHLVLSKDCPYELRDNDGRPVTKKEAKRIIVKEFTVPEHVRKRLRSRKKSNRKKGAHPIKQEALINQSSISEWHPIV